MCGVQSNKQLAERRSLTRAPTLGALGHQSGCDRLEGGVRRGLPSSQVCRNPGPAPAPPALSPVSAGFAAFPCYFLPEDKCLRISASIFLPSKWGHGSSATRVTLCTPGLSTTSRHCTGTTVTLS